MKVTLSIPRPSNKSYTVSGKSIREVFDALQKHGWWGRYRSNEGMSYSGKSSTVDTIKVSASPVIFMPSWTGYSKASKAEQQSWDKMYKALKKHEENHHEIFLSSADDWKKEMEKNGNLSEKDTKAAWSDFTKATQKKQDAYDTKTDHGQKEGVILDLP
ncbi:MAG TPA: DUF922 domain-containing protein [Paracoccaceae bacterium]|nr:DUF922 domain-containing protein [Paracoccaceae bacterium]